MEIEEELPEKESEKILTREEVLAITSRLITRLKDSPTRRYRDPDLEKLRSGWTRIVIQCIDAHANLLKDSELDELKKRIAILEQVKGIDNGNI
jgi:hypothetical protein